MDKLTVIASLDQPIVGGIDPQFEGSIHSTNPWLNKPTQYRSFVTFFHSGSEAAWSVDEVEVDELGV